MARLRRQKKEKETERKKQILRFIQNDKFGVSVGMFMPMTNQKKRSIITAYPKTISYE